MEQLMTTKEVASLMKVSCETATSFLTRQGIRSINFGRGRGLGRRWVREQIERLIEQLTAPQQQTRSSRPRKPVPTPSDLSKLSPEDFVALVQKGRHAT